MSTKACSKDKDNDKNKNTEAKFKCKKCGATAEKENHLCKPKQLK